MNFRAKNTHIKLCLKIIKNTKIRLCHRSKLPKKAKKSHFCKRSELRYFSKKNITSRIFAHIAHSSYFLLISITAMQSAQNYFMSFKILTRLRYSSLPNNRAYARPSIFTFFPLCTALLSSMHAMFTSVENSNVPRVEAQLLIFQANIIHKGIHNAWRYSYFIMNGFLGLQSSAHKTGQKSILRWKCEFHYARLFGSVTRPARSHSNLNFPLCTFIRQTRVRFMRN